MEKIVITNAVGIHAKQLEKDNSIIKGKDFYFGKIKEKLPQQELRCNSIISYLADRLNLESINPDKTGIVIATTNAGIEEYTNTFNKHYAELGNPAEFLKNYLHLNSFACSVSTACSSGIKAFVLAKQLLEENVCTSVIVGGVDPIASTPSYGFNALEVFSDEKTNPFSVNRSGMNIGEAGALFILKKNTEGIRILGIGETSDAYHSATPDPIGEQAARAIELALTQAQISAKGIDYINLHGTGTIANDIMEANAVYKIFQDKVPSSSTKPITGHCLGAAASIEAYFCYKILKGEIKAPKHIYDGYYDPQLPPINIANEDFGNVNICMNNAFGFGGTNAVMIMGN